MLGVRVEVEVEVEAGGVMVTVTFEGKSDCTGGLEGMVGVQS